MQDIEALRDPFILEETTVGRHMVDSLEVIALRWLAPPTLRDVVFSRLANTKYGRIRTGDLLWLEPDLTNGKIIGAMVACICGRWLDNSMLACFLCVSLHESVGHGAWRPVVYQPAVLLPMSSLRGPLGHYATADGNVRPLFPAWSVKLRGLS